MKKRYVIYLIGWPGVGKLTIAKEIQKHDDSFVIMHNHLFNDCIFPFVPSDKPTNDESWAAVSSIKDVVFDFIINHGRRDQSLIFTNILTDKYADEGYKTIKQVEDLANKTDSFFIPVRLLCDPDEIKKRMVNKDRAKFHKTQKIEVIDGLVKNNYTVLTSDHPNELTLDVTNLKPHEVKDIIFKHCEMIK